MNLRASLETSPKKMNGTAEAIDKPGLKANVRG
jgi:hypothetical protein